MIETLPSSRPLALLMEWFPDLHKAEFSISADDTSSPLPDVEGLAARCPTVHIGGIEGIIHFTATDDGMWVMRGCDMGCSPAEIADAVAISRRTPGEDDDDETPAIIKRTIQSRALAFTRDGLRASPPDRIYMLRDANTGEGIFIQGRVGILAAPGGSGKSWTLAQLAVAMATGATWFGPRGWTPVRAGRVLMALAEEEPEEVRRMLHFAARAQGATSDEDLDAICSRITALDVTGMNVALTKQEDDGAALPETPFAKALREELRIAAQAGDPYVLVILDPLSYFGGFDIEKDNAAATRWVQVLRTFTTQECGSSSVIVAHHEKKKGEGDDPASADAIRGASALKDGVRWAARLSQEKRSEGSADLLTLRVVKANGVPPREPLILCRSHDYEGALRVATPDEADSNEAIASRNNKIQEKLQPFIDYCLTHICVGDTVNANEFVNNAPHGRQVMLAAVRYLVKCEALVRAERGVLSRPVPNGSTGSRTNGPVGSTVPPLRSRGNQEPEPDGTKPLQFNGSGSETRTEEVT